MAVTGVREIANAVLYEGYLLYPYRRSALKNRQRWTYGVLCPREYSEAQGGLEPWFMRTECLLVGSSTTTVTVTVRFLHLLACAPISQEPTCLTQVAGMYASLSMGDQQWEEGIEREITSPMLVLADLVREACEVPFTFPGEQLVSDPVEPIKRVQAVLAGSVHISATELAEGVYKLAIEIANTTPDTATIHDDYMATLLQSCISTHTILQTQQGEFVSQQDPPPHLRTLADSCHCVRTWPVLVGNTGEHTTLLSAPIILYDYPQIALESPGALFDGTEIDEILSLRIMTLSDDEKKQIRREDSRAREILERTEALSGDDLLKLHGVLRDPRLPLRQEMPEHTHPGDDYLPPTSVQIGTQEIRAGDHVRVWPSKRADALDFMLTGKTARVELIEQDLENRLYLVVTLDDDPGREQWDDRVLPGHRFFFFPEELEPLPG